MKSAVVIGVRSTLHSLPVELRFSSIPTESYWTGRRVVGESKLGRECGFALSFILFASQDFVVMRNYDPKIREPKFYIITVGEVRWTGGD